MLGPGLTSAAILAGAAIGYRGMIRGLLESLKRELGTADKLRVIATGGDDQRGLVGVQGNAGDELLVIGQRRHGPAGAFEVAADLHDAGDADRGGRRRDDLPAMVLRIDGIGTSRFVSASPKESAAISYCVG